MSFFKIDENIFIELMKSIKKLIKKVEELITTYKRNNPADNLNKKWLDGQDVCNMLHIGVRTLQKYRSEETIPYTHIGGKIFYNVHDIEKLLEKNYRKD